MSETETMETIHKRLPRDKQDDVQLAYESLNDWYVASRLIDTRRPTYFYLLVACWLATVATAFDISLGLLIWLIGRFGMVAIWFGAVSFFLLYANCFLEAKKLGKLIGEAKAELRALGLEYVKPKGDDAGKLRSKDPGAPFDPYDAGHFE